MVENPAVEVHLYGKLRRAADCNDVAGDCVVRVPVAEGTTIADVLARLSIALEDTSNHFLNGELSAPGRGVGPGDRLGIFPSDMATLYKWYFTKQE
jgi:hypothetical protein